MPDRGQMLKAIRDALLKYDGDNAFAIEGMHIDGDEILFMSDDGEYRISVDGL